MLTVNGVDLMPYVKDYSVVVSDLDSDSSGRNAKGEMLRDRIRTIKKISVTLNPLTNNEVRIVMNAMQSVFFSVTYLDPYRGTSETGNFYVGDRTAPVYGKIVYNGAEQWLWNGVTFNLTEK